MTKHEKLTNLIKRLKRDYPHMLCCDIAKLALEELGIDDNLQLTTSDPVVFNGNEPDWDYLNNKDNDIKPVVFNNRYEG